MKYTLLYIPANIYQHMYIKKRKVLIFHNCRKPYEVTEAVDYSQLTKLSSLGSVPPVQKFLNYGIGSQGNGIEKDSPQSSSKFFTNLNFY